jgi:YHS domain-containing protein
LEEHPLRNLSLKALAAAIVLAAGNPAPAMAGEPAVYTAPFSKLAIEGYDPVSYFSGSPTKGDPRFSQTHKGVEYRFASAANLARFRADPDAYLPQYGGYCAWAVSRGYTAKGDPRAWKLVGGKLYLNYDAKVQERWAADVPGNIEKANKNWPQVLK